MSIPLRIPGGRATKIIQQRTAYKLDNFETLVDLVYPDQVFPGQITISGQERLIQYLKATTDPKDFMILQSEKYVEAYEEGVKTGNQIVPLPTSQYWLDALSIPSQFAKMTADFRRLLAEYKK